MGEEDAPAVGGDRIGGRRGRTPPRLEPGRVVRRRMGDLGPDLTHVGSRGSLAAGTLPNSEAGFGGWISGNQAIKPGARMPQYRMAGADLHALAVYLEGLK